MTALKKKVWRIAVAVLLTFSLSAGAWAPLLIGETATRRASAFSGGDGTQFAPYLVSTPQEFDAIRNNLGASYKLTANIDLGAYAANGGWNPIGTETSPFLGTVDGDGYAVSNVTIDREGVDGQGLFGYVGAGATIRNLGIASGQIIGGTLVGGIAAYSKGTIIGCYNRALVGSKRWNALPTYGVTFNLDGGEFVSPADTALSYQTVEYGKAATAPQATQIKKTGYTFVKWDTPYISITADTTVTAVWEINKYSVTFNLNGGTHIGGGALQQQITYLAGVSGAELPLLKPPAGKAFAGWNGVAEGGGAAYVESIVAPSAFTPIWADAVYTVRLNLNGGALDGSAGTVEYDLGYRGRLYLPREPQKTGNAFSHWRDTENGATYTNEGIANVEIVKNREFTAQWTPGTATYKFISGNTVLQEYRDVEYGNSVQAPDLPQVPGRNMESWIMSAGGDGATDVATVQPGEYITSFGSSGEFTPYGDDTRYTVLFYLEGGSFTYNGSVYTGTLTLNQLENATVTVPDPDREGYTFSHWKNMADNSQANSFATSGVLFDGDKTFQAVYTANKYTVTFNFTGGTFNGATSNTQFDISYGDAIAQPSPLKNGHTFVNWKEKGGSVTKSEVEMRAFTVTRDWEFDAQWTINSYSVNFNLDGGAVYIAANNGWVTSYITDVSYENKVQPNNIPGTNTGTTGNMAVRKTGYHLWNVTHQGASIWLDENNDPVDVANTNITQVRTFKLRWEINTYDVTFDLNGGTYEGSNAAVVIPTDHGSTVVPPASTSLNKDGHTFGGWRRGAGTTAETNFTITEATTFTAIWSVNTYTVTFNLDGGSVNGSTANQTRSRTYDAAVGAPPAPTRVGNHLVLGYEWEDVATGTTYSIAQVTSYAVKSNVTFKANWEINTYTVTLNLNGGTHTGSVNGFYTINNVEHGTNSTLITPTPPAQQRFTGWKNAAGAWITTPVVITGDITYTAQYGPLQVTVTFRLDGGTHTGGGALSQTVNSGSGVTEPTFTKQGYDFQYWIITGMNTRYTGGFTNVTNDLDLTAYYTVKQYTVTFNFGINNVGGIDNSGNSPYTGNQINPITGNLTTGANHGGSVTAPALTRTVFNWTYLFNLRPNGHSQTEGDRTFDGKPLKIEVDRWGAERNGQTENCYLVIYSFEGWDGGDVNNITGNTTFTARYTARWGYDPGGIVGILDGSGTVEQCYNAGEINGTVAGGIVGTMLSGQIRDCYNLSAVSGLGADSKVGGIVGHAYLGEIVNVYNVGDVSKLHGEGVNPNADDVGAIVGRSEKRSESAIEFTIEHAYYDNQKSVVTVGVGGDAASASLMGRTTTQMYIENTYNGFGFGSVWEKANGEHTPILKNLLDRGGSQGAGLTFSVRFSGNGGVKTEGKDYFIVSFDGSISPDELPEYFHPYMSRVGWTESATTTLTDASFTNIRRDMDVKAKWNANEYVIRFSGGTDGNGAVANDPSLLQQSVGYGELPTVPTFTRIGFTFTGWNNSIVPATATNVIYTAQWNANPRVTFDGNGGRLKGGSATAMAVEVEYMGAVAFGNVPEFTRDHYTFAGWSGSYVGVTGNKTVKAEWTANKYEVRFHANGGARVTGSGGNEVQQAEYGKPVTAPTYKKEDYRFAGWSLNPDTMLPANLSQISGETDVYAMWTYDWVTVTFSGGAGATLASGAEAVPVRYGTNVETSKIPSFIKTDWVFNGWDKALTGIKADVTINAKWAVDTSKTLVAVSDGVAGKLLSVTGLPELALEGVSYGYQWQKYENGNWKNVPGSTADSLTLSAEESEGFYRVKITVSVYGESGQTAFNATVHGNDGIGGAGVGANPGGATGPGDNNNNNGGDKPSTENKTNGGLFGIGEWQSLAVLFASIAVITLLAGVLVFAVYMRRREGRGDGNDKTRWDYWRRHR